MVRDSIIVRPVAGEDIEPVVEALVSAFAGDPLMRFLFGEGFEERPHVGEFFRILLDVRVALAMPALCADDDGIVVGATMGYDVSRPAWSERHLEQWERLMTAVPGLEARLGEYERLAEEFQPSSPHFYLGVIGVRNGRKGHGVGQVLIDAFCDASAKDATSSGVYLETASEDSLRFYLKNGFEIRGEGMLGGNTKLWCVFRPTAASID